MAILMVWSITYDLTGLDTSINDQTEQYFLIKYIYVVHQIIYQALTHTHSYIYIYNTNVGGVPQMLVCRLDIVYSFFVLFILIFCLNGIPWYINDIIFCLLYFDVSSSTITQPSTIAVPFSIDLVLNILNIRGAQILAKD